LDIEYDRALDKVSRWTAFYQGTMSASIGNKFGLRSAFTALPLNPVLAAADCNACASV